MLDAFAGSGTTGAVALECGRKFFLIDENPQAIEVMYKRFKGQHVVFDAPEVFKVTDPDDCGLPNG